MGYAAEADIRRHLGKFSPGWPPAGGTPPTVADGIESADAASGEIDGILSGRGLMVPVAAPASFIDHLRDLAALKAASIVIAQIYPQATGPASTALHRFWMDLYNEGLKRLREDPLPGDATLTAAGGMGRSFHTSNPDYFAEDHEGTPGNQTDPVFRRDTSF